MKRSIMFFFTVLLIGALFVPEAGAVRRKNTSTPSQTGKTGSREDVLYAPDEVKIDPRSNEWMRVLLKDNPLSSKAMKQLDSILYRNKKTYSMAVVIDGSLVYTFGDIKVPQDIRGVNTGICSILCGHLNQEKPKLLDQPLSETRFILDKRFTKDDYTVTLRQMLGSRSDIILPVSRLDSVQLLGVKRGTYKPGDCFIPSMFDNYMVIAILRKLYNMSYYNLVRKNLALPLRMQNFQANRRDATRICMSVQDLLRVAELMHHNGKWFKRQLIPEKWVQLTRTVIPDKEKLQRPVYNPKLYHGFGLGWWVLKSDIPEINNGFSTGDNIGNFVTVLPMCRMTVVLLSKPNNGIPILPGMKRSDFVTPEEFREILAFVLKSRK